MAKSLSRRTFFKVGLATIAAAPVGYAVITSFGGYAPRAGLKHLSTKHAAVVEAVGGVFIPSENNPIGISIQEAGLVQNVDDYLGICPKFIRGRFKILLLAVEHR